MECKPRHNTVDTPTLFWAGIPGNEADFPAEESFYTFLGQALCLFVEETNYKSSLSPFGIKMVDRVSGRPLHIDISDLPMKKGITTNRNKFILGPSGSGKSFFTNHMVRRITSRGRTCCWSIRVTVTWGCPSLSQPHARRGRDLFHLHQREPDSVQPVLCRGRGIRHREEREHQDPYTHPVEAG